MERVSVKGRWQIEVTDPAGKVKHSFWKDNLVVDEGLDALLDATFNSTDNPNLIPNGTFDTADTGWSDSVATGAYAAGPVNGRSNVFQVDTAAGYSYTTGGFTTVVGNVYRINFAFYSSGTGNGYVYVGTAAGDSTNLTSGSLTDTSWTDYTLYFVATATTTYVSVGCSDANAQYYDSIEVFDVTGKQWFVMPVGSTAPTPDAAHDYADITAGTIEEEDTYSETQRQPYDVDASDTQTIDNGDPTDQRATFSINGTTSIYGTCLVGTPTKSDVAETNILFSYSKFDAAIPVTSGDTFKARVVISIT